MTSVLVVDPDSDTGQPLDALIDRACPSCTVTRVDEPGEALEFVRQRGEYANASRPDLVVLDLDGAESDHFDLLSDLKTDSAARTIPTIVAATSAADEDVTRSYRLGANAYVQKPSDPDEVTDVASVLTNFWFTTVELPPAE